MPSLSTRLSLSRVALVSYHLADPFRFASFQEQEKADRKTAREARAKEKEDKERKEKEVSRPVPLLERLAVLRRLTSSPSFRRTGETTICCCHVLLLQEAVGTVEEISSSQV